MNRLPAEIWLEICHLVSKKRDLSSLSLVSRSAYAFVAPVLYSSLTVRFQSSDDLQAVVSELAEDGLGYNFLKHARKLTILCAKRGSLRHSLKDWGIQPVHYRVPATKDAFVESLLTGPCPVFETTFPLSGYRWFDGDLEPLASLVARLSRLRQLDFIVQGPGIPSSLQKAISQHHPDCQISIWGADSSHPNILNYPLAPNDIQWQSLHTLAMNVAWESFPNANTVRLVRSLPSLLTLPGVRHLVLQNYQIPSYALIEGFATPAKRGQRSSLKSLSLLGQGSNEAILQTLMDTVDLSALQSLDLHSYANPVLLEKLALRLPDLERLFISRAPLLARLRTELYGTSLSTIQAFTKLKFLCLRGYHTMSDLDPILDKHGESLRTLILEPSFVAYRYSPPWPVEPEWHSFPRLTDSDIGYLAEKCPNLQELRVPIRREQGGPRECRMYKALGQFSNLRTLILDLSFGRVYESEVLSDGRIHPSELEHVLPNAATDEDLALEIWNLITSNQASGKLRDLRIAPLGLESFPHKRRYLLSYFARSFLLTRYNPANPGFPAVEEIGKMAWDSWREDNMKHAGRYEDIPPKIWPLASKRDGRWTGWCSFPLEPESGI